MTAREMDDTGRRNDSHRSGDIVGPCHMITMPSADAVRNRAALPRWDTGRCAGGSVTMHVTAEEWNMADADGGTGMDVA